MAEQTADGGGIDREVGGRSAGGKPLALKRGKVYDFSGTTEVVTFPEMPELMFFYSPATFLRPSVREKDFNQINISSCGTGWRSRLRPFL